MWRRPLLIIPLVAVALLCQGCLEVSGAKLRTQALENPDRRWFARPCESVWPEAIRTLTSEGFRLVARDPAGGIASFMWADERRMGRLRATGDLEEFILPEEGGARHSGNVRIECAVLEASPKNRGCELRLRISYAAPKSSFGMKRGWVAVASSGRYEQRLLERLAPGERAAQYARRHTGRGVEAPAPTVAGRPGSEPTADSEGLADIAETRVIRLDGGY